MKKILILGGTGSIGLATTKLLAEQGYNVMVTAHTHEAYNAFSVWPIVGTQAVIFDVTYDQAQWHECFTKNHPPFDAIIYSVGHCPPGEFAGHTGKSISTMSPDLFKRHMDIVNGLFNTIQASHFLLKENGALVVVGASVTRMEDTSDERGLNLVRNLSHHMADAHAVRSLTLGAQRDVDMKAKGYRVSLVEFPAVETLFHPAGHPYPAVPLDEAANKLIEMIDHPVGAVVRVEAPLPPK